MGFLHKVLSSVVAHQLHNNPMSHKTASLVTRGNLEVTLRQKKSKSNAQTPAARIVLHDVKCAKINWENAKMLSFWTAMNWLPVNPLVAALSQTAQFRTTLPPNAKLITLVLP